MQHQSSKPNTVLNPHKDNHLFSPVIDFLTLGGGSAVLLLALLLFSPKPGYQEIVVFLTIYIAYVINNPHFANSYQLFYSDFRSAMAADETPKPLRFRYVFAGIVVPVIMAVYFMIAVILPAPELFKWSISAMFFFVGWHYVKQGYGIAMVDAACKKAYYKDDEKKALLFIAYTAWLANFIFLNSSVSAGSFQGLEYYALDLPESFRVPAQAIVYTLAIASLIIFAKKIINDKARAPFNGMIAYFVSIFLWIAMIATHPLYATLIPVFHSLQYMAVVWRLKLNQAKKQDKSRIISLGKFVITGIILGVIGFNLIPYFMENTIPKPDDLSSAAVFFIACGVFINIHHYFIDNVIWRKENKQISTYLFAK